MLPVIDYGNIAIVIANITAIGSVVINNEGFGFEVYLNGREKPILIGEFEEDEAEESRRELIGIVAQYYFTKEYGPDFELEDIMESFDGDEFDEMDEDLEEDSDENNDDDKH